MSNSNLGEDLIKHLFNAMNLQTFTFFRMELIKHRWILLALAVHTTILEGSSLRKVCSILVSTFRLSEIAKAMHLWS